MKRKDALTHVAMGAVWPNDVTITCNNKLYETPDDWEWTRISNEYYLFHPDKKPIAKADYLAERKRLINKPSWSDAPEWATHLIQRHNGLWFWDTHEEDWYLRASEGKVPAGHDVSQTREARPKTPPKHANCRCVQVAVGGGGRSESKTVHKVAPGGGLGLHPKTPPKQISGHRVNQTLNEINFDRRDTVEAWQVVEAMLSVGYDKPQTPAPMPTGNIDLTSKEVNMLRIALNLLHRDTAAIAHKLDIDKLHKRLSGLHK